MAVAARPRGRGAVRTLVSALLVLALLSVLLLIGAALVVQSRLDEASLTQRIEREVLRQTGRRLTLEGLRVRLLPVPTLEARGVALDDWTGGLRPRMLTAAGVQAHLALLPLLRHAVRLEGVTLTQPDILLERNAAGQANWQLHKPASADTGGGSGGGGGRWSLQIGSLRLLDGRLALQDALQGWSGAVEGLHVEASGLAGDRPAAAFSGRHGNAALDGDLRTGSLARLDRSDGSRTPWILRLTAHQRQNGQAVAGVSIDGTLSDPAHGRGYALDVAAQAQRLDSLNALFTHARLPDVAGLSLRARVTDAAPAGAPRGDPQLGFLSLRSGAFQAAALRPSRWTRDLSVAALSVDAKDRTTPVAVSLDGRWRDQPLALHGTAGTLGAWQQGAAGSGWGPVPLALELAAGTARGRVDGTAGSAGSDLRVAATVPALQPLLGAGPALTELTLSGRAQTQGGTALTLSDLRLASPQLALTGSATLLDVARPTLTAAINATHADLDALRAGWISPAGAADAPTGPPPSSGAPAASPGAGPHRADVPTSAPATTGGPADRPATAPTAPPTSPFAALRQADMAVRLDAHEVRFGGETYRDLAAQLAVQDGRLTLAPFTVAGPAGPIAGQLRAEASGHVSLALQPSMIRAETLASWLGLSPLLSGTVELVADLQGTSATTQALAASLTGRAGASLVDGSIANAALAALVGRSAGLSQTGRTELRCLALPAQLSDGQARIAPIALQTRTLDLQGHGTVALGDGRLDLHLVPRLSIGTAGASLPVHVGGTLDAPQVALDPAAAGGRFTLTIGPGGPAPDACGAALQAARFGAAGPQPGPEPAAGRQHKAPKPIDILRGLGLFR